MYNKKAHIHFVGIGGIGMSGIAKILHYRGYRISGCDVDINQKSVRDLLSLGCAIYAGNNAVSCYDNSIDVVVYSSAVKNTDPEIVAAQKRGIPTIPRALMLAELMRVKYSVAIAGSHGKTTTTSLISHILFEARRDPTVIIGGHLQSISTNAHYGSGEFLIAEADESDRSLIRLHPTIAVVTNIDREHLDVYADLQDVKETFGKFLNNIPFYGKAIVCVDDENVRSILPLPYTKTVTYGLTSEADFYADDCAFFADYSTCTVREKNKKEPHGFLKINMPGRHNVLNALAACTVAFDLGVTFDTVARALASFKGVDRRFTLRGTYRGAEIFDDYGHHPEEIRNTLSVARNRARGRLLVIFQPHRYTRTLHLWKDFISVFSQNNVDRLFITDIYAASEEPIPDVTSERLVRDFDLAQNIAYVPADKDFEEVKRALDSCIGENDLVLLLGAGSIYKLAERLVSEQSRK